MHGQPVVAFVDGLRLVKRLYRHDARMALEAGSPCYPHSRSVPRWTAVCVGIGSTKRLATLANHRAKKAFAGGEGVCDFTVMAQDARMSCLGTFCDA